VPRCIAPFRFHGTAMKSWTRGHRIALGVLLFALAIEGLMLAPSCFMLTIATPLGIIGLLLFVEALIEHK
jgi:hypothetical protein